MKIEELTTQEIETTASQEVVNGSIRIINKLLVSSLDGETIDSYNWGLGLAGSPKDMYFVDESIKLESALLVDREEGTGFLLLARAKGSHTMNFQKFWEPERGVYFELSARRVKAWELENIESLQVENYGINGWSSFIEDYISVMNPFSNFNGKISEPDIEKTKEIIPGDFSIARSFSGEDEKFLQINDFSMDPTLFELRRTLNLINTLSTQNAIYKRITHIKPKSLIK